MVETREADRQVEKVLDDVRRLAAELCDRVEELRELAKRFERGGERASDEREPAAERDDGGGDS